MEKIAILTDSCADVPPEFIERYNIVVMPLLVNYEDGTYYDRVDIFPQQIYDRLDEELPKTSTPSPADFAVAYNKLEEEGFTHVLAITMSANLSGTFNVAEQAAKASSLTIEVIDTLSTGLGEGSQVIYAAELLDAGCSFDEIIEKVRRSIQRSNMFLVLDTLDYLHRGGRIGNAAHMLGTALKICPIVKMDPEGKVVMAAKTRGHKAARRKAVELLQDLIKDSNDYQLISAYGIDAVAGEELKQQMLAAVKPGPTEHDVISSQLSPVIAVHTGPGIIAIGAQIRD